MPVNPESQLAADLLPAQEALRDACTLILEGNVTEVVINSEVKAADVQAELRAGSLHDLVLPDGSNLSIDNPDGRASRKKSADAEERLRARWLGDAALMSDQAEDDAASGNANRIGMPDLGLQVGPDTLAEAGIAVRRQVASKLNYWQDRLCIFLRYANERYQAFEVLTAKTDAHWTNGDLRVKLSSHVTSPSYYGGLHNGGHLVAYRKLGQEKQDTAAEVFGFIELIHELYANRTQE